jgi:hypothetical protein
MKMIRIMTGGKEKAPNRSRIPIFLRYKKERDKEKDQPSSFSICISYIQLIMRFLSYSADMKN